MQQRGSSCRGQPRPRATVRFARASSPSAPPTRRSEPAWFNGAVASFGRENADSARLLIVGLAPGLRGRQSHRPPVHRRLRGRPAVRDAARLRLCARTLRGKTRRRPRAGRLPDHQRRALRAAREQADPGRDRDLPAVPDASAWPPCRSLPPSSRSGASHTTARWPRSARARPASRSPTARATTIRPGLALFDSFHCSRYNTNTGRLTPEMFRAVFAAVRGHLGKP